MINKGKRDNNSLDKIHLQLEKLWVKRVKRDGDRTAFKKIFKAYYKRLHEFATSFVGRQEAEDVVQSVFLNIWAQKESWTPPKSLKNYLFGAVKNEALNVIRHKNVVDDAEEEVVRKFRELKELDEKADVGSTDVEKLRQDIEEGIEQLPPRCRQIFMLNRRSGLTYKEIAEVLDLSIGTINTQMGRALEKLRNHLSDYFTAVAFFSLSEFLMREMLIMSFIFL